MVRWWGLSGPSAWADGSDCQLPLGCGHLPSTTNGRLIVNACNMPPVSFVPPAMMHLPSTMASAATLWRSANRVVSLVSLVAHLLWNEPVSARATYRAVKSPALFDLLDDENWPEDLRCQRRRSSGTDRHSTRRPPPHRR